MRVSAYSGAAQCRLRRSNPALGLHLLKVCSWCLRASVTPTQADGPPDFNSAVRPGGSKSPWEAPNCLSTLHCDSGTASCTAASVETSQSPSARTVRHHLISCSLSSATIRATSHKHLESTPNLPLFFNQGPRRKYPKQ